MKHFVYLIISILLISACKKEKNFFSEFESVDLNAEKGQIVLAPDFESLNQLQNKSPDSVVFLFFKRILIEKGKEKSKITDGIDTGFIPNFLIIPLEKGKPEKGKVILTWNRLTNVMQKAYVIGEDKNGQTVIHYLDNEFTPDMYEAGFTLDVANDTLQTVYYRELKDDFVQGVSFFAKKDNTKFLYSLINIKNNKILGLQWSGTFNIFNKNNCELLPLDKLPKINDSVEVPYFGIIIKAEVKKVDSLHGRIWVSAKIYDEIKYFSVGIGNFKIIKK